MAEEMTTMIKCGWGAVVVVCVSFSSTKNVQILGKASDWLKFEMERSDWSCAYCRQGRHGIISYYRSNVQILGKHLIGREQFHHQGGAME